MYSIVMEESCNFDGSSEKVTLEDCTCIKIYVQYIFHKNSSLYIFCQKQKKFSLFVI